MIDNEVVSRIAQKIRAARLVKNLTIQEVAERSSVSKGLLSKIENSRTVPSLPVFISLIHSLDLSLKEFFEDMVLMNGKDYVYISKDAYQPLSRDERPGFNYLHILSQNITNCTMEVTLLTLEPGVKGNPTVTDGYEFRYILEGKCDYYVNNDSIQLDEGDSIYFDASKPHLPANHSRKKVIMLVIYFLLPK